MIRVIVKTSEFGDAANIGGHVVETIKTFDIEAAEVEKYIQAKNFGLNGIRDKWSNTSIIGVELLTH